MRTNHVLLRRLLTIICVFTVVAVQAKQWTADEIKEDRFVQAGKAVLTISNESHQQRQEVVEVDYQAVCKQLGITTDEQVVIENAAGQEVSYQKTYDGKLLLYVSLHPNGKAVYTLSKGKPAVFKSYVQGKMYPIRKDDLAWENDLGIYRVYGPALQKTGERSYGIDVWVKNTPDLVLEDRYQKDYRGNIMEDSLRKAGQKVHSTISTAAPRSIWIMATAWTHTA